MELLTIGAFARVSRLSPTRPSEGRTPGTAPSGSRPTPGMGVVVAGRIVV